VKNLTNDPAADSGPNWSPDGSQRAGGGHIFVMDADRSNVKQITSDPNHGDGGPAWSPDGTMIAFVD
jgi:hypothetical protein